MLTSHLHTIVQYFDAFTVHACCRTCRVLKGHERKQHPFRTFCVQFSQSGIQESTL
jgi:hypothetical protein